MATPVVVFNVCLTRLVLFVVACRWVRRAEREARRPEQVDVVREASGSARALAGARRRARPAVRGRAQYALLAGLVAPPPQAAASPEPEGARARALAAAIAPQAQPDQSRRDRRPQAPAKAAAAPAAAAGEHQ